MARISSPSSGVTVWSAAMQAAHAASRGWRLDSWTWASNTVTPDEGELMRAIADALGCPMPPLLPGQALA